MATHRDLNTDTDLQGWIGKQVELDLSYISDGLRLFGTITGYLNGQWYARGHMNRHFGSAGYRSRLVPFYPPMIISLEA